MNILIVLLICLGVAKASQVSSEHEPFEGDTGFKYLEFYRATKGETHIYVHGTLHIANFNEMPDILIEQIETARQVFLERFSTIQEYQEVNSPESEALRAKYQKRSNEPDWFRLFREHRIKSDEVNPVSIYDFLNQNIATNLARIANQCTVEQLLTNCSSFGILALIGTCVAEETNDPSTTYDSKIASHFRKSGKIGVYMETPTEVMSNIDGIFSDEITEVIEKSVSNPVGFIDLVKEFLCRHSQTHKFYELLYRQGWGAYSADLFESNSKFLYNRTNLWFERYLESSNISSLNESLFCMGVGHLHSSFEDNDIQKPVGEGFLGKLEKAGWKLENLHLSGHWIPWSVNSHLAWLKDQELEAKTKVQKLFPGLFQ